MTSQAASLSLATRWSDEAWAALLDAEYTALVEQGKLKRSHGKRPEHCVKEALPAFVSFLVQQADLRATDVFWDLGCGIGNVVGQVAVQVGCPCHGVELQPENFEVATRLWESVCAALDRAGASHGSATFLNCCMTTVADRITDSVADGAKVLVWLNNLLLPEAVNLNVLDMLADRLPAGARVATTRPLFPHTRGAKRGFKRYADVFSISQATYPADFVEWGASGTVYFYDVKPRPAPA